MLQSCDVSVADIFTTVET